MARFDGLRDAASPRRYIGAMSKAAAGQPLTTMVPLTTMEEMPLPSAAERAAMIASLENGEAAIAAGESRAHDPPSFVGAMQTLRGAAKRAAKA